MRSLLSRVLLPFLLIVPALTAASAETTQLANVEEDVLGTPKSVPTGTAAPVENKIPDDEEQPTTFNGITVPPMKNFNGDAFDKEAKEGYWYI